MEHLKEIEFLVQLTVDMLLNLLKEMKTFHYYLITSLAGEVLKRFLDKILPTLVAALSNCEKYLNKIQELEYCQAVINICR